MPNNKFSMFHLMQKEFKFKSLSIQYDRAQQVNFNNVWSNILTIEHGMPQWYVLSSFIFIIYINVIVNVHWNEYNIKMWTIR